MLGSEEQRRKALAWSWCGIEKSTWDRSSEGYAWQYNVKEIGYKYRANDLTAALALDQWLNVERERLRKSFIVQQYNDALAGLSWLQLPKERAGTFSSWQEYIVRTKARDRLHDHLAELGVSTTVHYYPLNNYLPFHWIEDGIVVKQELPITEKLWKQILTIPCYPSLSQEERERIIDGIRSFKP